MPAGIKAIIKGFISYHALLAKHLREAPFQSKSRERTFSAFLVMNLAAPNVMRLLPGALYSLRGALKNQGVLRTIFASAKASRSNLHSFACRRACRLSSFDYDDCPSNFKRGVASHTPCETP